MAAGAQLVVFWLDDQRFALPLTAVQRVVRAAEVTPVPGAPGAVAGMVDLKGEVIPVIDLRNALGLPERPLGVADQFLIAQTPDRTLALIVDKAQGLIPGDACGTKGLRGDGAWTEWFQGVAQLDDGLVLIHDIEKFLSPAEAITLDEAMKDAL